MQIQRLSFGLIFVKIFFMPYLEKIVVFGSQGQVATAFKKILPTSARFISQSDVSFQNLGQLHDCAQRIPASVMICPAAYTKVDLAEKEVDLCMAVNSLAPEILAQVCRERGIPLVWYSSDYVFDGSGTTPKSESDLAGPLNTYGRSKLEGEQRIRAVGCDALIFRTSWVISPTGSNFVKTMLKLGSEREELRIVADQWGAPTSAADLAQATIKALVHAQQACQKTGVFPSGIYHLTNSGTTSWYELALEIFSRARARGVVAGGVTERKLILKVKNVIGISSEEYPTPALRPKNSRLSNVKFIKTFGFQMRPWEDGLNEILDVLLNEA